MPISNPAHPYLTPSRGVPVEPGGAGGYTTNTVAGEAGEAEHAEAENTETGD